MLTFALTTKKIIQSTANTICIYFDVPQNFTYKAGQYITLKLIINGKEVRRPYSLSSCFGVDEELYITVKLIENGDGSRYLHNQVKVGDSIEVLKPNGQFILPENKPKQIIFLAAGSGISPIISLIKEALYHTNSKVLLVYSNSSIESTIFYNELKELSKIFSGTFEIIWLFCNHKNLRLARLNRFMLEEIVHLHVAQKNEVLFYTCGPFNYMEMIFITLLTMGYKQEQLYKETFTIHDDEDDDEGSLITEKNTPAYVDAFVTVNMHNKQFKFKLLAGESILQAAEKHNIDLPYSCSQGMCSTCACQLNNGEVYLRYNQVLTDKDITEGRILTCTGHPITNEVEISIIAF